MSNYVLGIHLGHHCSVALVENGELISAVMLERCSRLKHHSLLSLSNELPINDVLNPAGINIEDVDLIVSSFQATAQAGFGLDRPLIEESFDLFDPWANNHITISHHLAHCHSTFDASGFSDSAVIVCDYAGSSTRNGHDFSMSFSDWYQHLTSLDQTCLFKSECLSLYRAAKYHEPKNIWREFNIPHIGQASFIYSVAGLYENVSNYCFQTENAHGQLMALAAYANLNQGIDPGPLVYLDSSDNLVFLNNWQHKLPQNPDFDQKAILAKRCQEATEFALTHYAKEAKLQTNSRNLCVAGGVFLNILANTVLTESEIFDNFFVSSSPNDGGIAVGCAFHGSRKLADQIKPINSDRLGPIYVQNDYKISLDECQHFVQFESLTLENIVESLLIGNIVARFDGRSEFGPRALGGRSLLASPLTLTSKDRLNKIKGRQEWRPVAPIVIDNEFSTFFDGPSQSPWMTYAHTVKPSFRDHLVALCHPDGTTRAQVLSYQSDPELYFLISSFGQHTGFPVLVNTSLNRAGEPIIETPKQALDMFLDCSDIDILILGPYKVTRKLVPDAIMSCKLFLSERAFITTYFRQGAPVHFVSNGSSSWPITDKVRIQLQSMGEKPLYASDLFCAFKNDPSASLLFTRFLINGIISIL